MITTLRQWQKTNKNIDELIICASEYEYKNDNPVPFPIGLSQYITNFLNSGASFESFIFGKHNRTVLSNFSTVTDLNRRSNYKVNRIKIENILKLNGINNNRPKENWNDTIGINKVMDYFLFLSSYKFIVSPEGNGIDCHRHYESLIAGCIPIVEDSDYIRNQYDGCPILYTNDYSEINRNYLLRKYEEMIDKEYDFSKLYLNHYNIKLKNKIIENGNYWTGGSRDKISGKLFIKVDN